VGPGHRNGAGECIACMQEQDIDIRPGASIEDADLAAAGESGTVRTRIEHYPIRVLLCP
jgi:hypothetical protein